MPKKNQPGGCCCCRILYGGGALKTGNFAKMPGDPIEFPVFDEPIGSSTDDYPDPYQWPSSGSVYTSSLASGSPWAVDHYNEFIFLAGRNTPSVDNKAVVRMSRKVPLDAADIVLTAVPNISPTSTDLLRGVGCAPREERVFAIVSNAGSTTWTINATDYDGSNFASWAVDGAPTNVSALQWCHANDKLYYIRSKSGVDDGKPALYRCDIDGSNPEYVWHPGPNFGSPSLTTALPNAGYTFDNVGEKVYTCRRMINTSLGVNNYGEIYQMNLDGSSPSLIYTTSSLQNPWYQYGVQCMKYSHKDKSLYFICFNAEAGSAVDVFLYDGLFVMSDQEIADGVSTGAARYLKSMNQTDVLSNTNPPSIAGFDLGCGFETFGKGTKR